jgi:WD40 repeat protein
VQIVETYKVDDGNVLALAYCEELNIVLAAGMGGFISAIHLDQGQQSSASGQGELRGHSERITSLAILKHCVVASASYDRQIRFWDLHTLKEIEAARKVDAHQAPITRLSYAHDRDELASVALENVAKVWDVRRPHESRMRFQVETPGEISQLSYIPWRSMWLSTSGDGCMRLWSTDGELVFQFGHSGGSVQSLFVDAEAQLILAAAQDFIVRIFDLHDPVPKGR